MPETQVLRAYRFALDPTDAERVELARYAGACRWAYNYALAKKTESHRAWAARRAVYLGAGLSEAEAKARIKADGAELTDRIKVWDHHRKTLMATTPGKQAVAPFQPQQGRRHWPTDWPRPGRTPSPPGAKAGCWPRPAPRSTA